MTVPLPIASVIRAEATLQVAAAATQSPFTGTQQVQFWGGEWWSFDIELKANRGQQARALGAFLTALRGVVGTFLLDVPQRALGTVGAPLVNGAGQTGGALVTDGWTPSITAMQSGDFFSLGSGADTKLYQLTADVVVNGSGQATLQFVPNLRASPADNAALAVVAPRALLRPQSTIPYDPAPGPFFRVSFTAIEAI